ncbi:hypothetical protein RyT2_01980 [Pseudolactococcus yaeyamensis]
MKNRKIEVMSKKEIEALNVEELKEGIKPVFRGAEKKRRWQEVDNQVKVINGFKPEPIKDDEFSFIFNYIFDSWVKQWEDVNK